MKPATSPQRERSPRGSLPYYKAKTDAEIIAAVEAAEGPEIAAEFARGLIGSREALEKLPPSDTTRFRVQSAAEFCGIQEKEVTKPQPAGTLRVVDSERPAPARDPFITADTSAWRVQEPEEFAKGPALSWLVKGVLPQAAVAVIYGAWGSGKSFLAYSIAAAITRGSPTWFGHRVTKGNAVIICAEGQTGFRMRQKAYRVANECKLSELPGIIPASPNLLDKKAQAGVLAELEAYAARKGSLALVIVDTKSAVTPGANENAHETASALVEWCKVVRTATGATVCLIDHTGAVATDRTRGHTSLTGAADAQIRVERPNDKAEYRTWTTQKLKDGSDGEEQGFQLKSVSLEPDADGEEQNSCIVEPAERPAIVRSEGKLQGMYQPSVMKALKVLCAGGEPVDRAELISEALKDIDYDADDLEAVRQARKNLSDAITKLCLKGHTFKHPDKRISLSSAVRGINEGFDSK